MVNTDDANANGENAKEEDERLNRPSLMALADKGHLAVYDIIGLKLREYFNEIAHQPVPDRFVMLLQQLDSKINAEAELDSEMEK